MTLSPQRLEKAAEAMTSIPVLWVRTNKGRNDGLFHEVGYVEGDVISDETVHILGAFATYAQADVFRNAKRNELHAHAAISAYLGDDMVVTLEQLSSICAESAKIGVNGTREDFSAMLSAELTERGAG